jgi:hypothetical protein
MRTQNVPLFTNFSMVQDGYSNPFNLEMITSYSIQAMWSGTPTGSLLIQASNDPTTVGTPTNWTTLEPSIISTGGTSDNHLWKQCLAPFKWIRFGYVFTTGSGTLNANLNCKGTGQ